MTSPKIITEEEFNISTGVSRLERSFRNLVCEDFLVNHKKNIIHDVKNIAYHSGLKNLFHSELVDPYNRVKLEDCGMVNQYPKCYITQEIHNERQDWEFIPPSFLDALVIPFSETNGPISRIRLCISVEFDYVQQYEIKFRVLGSEHDTRLTCRPHNALAIIKQLQHKYI